MMTFFKTKTGKALLGVLAALGVLAGTLLTDFSTTTVDDTTATEAQQVEGQAVDGSQAVEQVINGSQAVDI